VEQINEEGKVQGFIEGSCITRLKKALPHSHCHFGHFIHAHSQNIFISVFKMGTVGNVHIRMILYLLEIEDNAGTIISL